MDRMLQMYSQGYIVSKIFFIIIHLLYAVACVAVSNLLVFLHKSNPSSCLATIVSKLKKGKGTTISKYARKNNDSFVLFCSVLLTAVDSL